MLHVMLCGEGEGEGKREEKFLCHVITFLLLLLLHGEGNVKCEEGEGACHAAMHGGRHAGSTPSCPDRLQVTSHKKKSSNFKARHGVRQEHVWANNVREERRGECEK